MAGETGRANSRFFAAYSAASGNNGAVRPGEVPPRQRNSVPTAIGRPMGSLPAEPWKWNATELSRHPEITCETIHSQDDETKQDTDSSDENGHFFDGCSSVLIR